MNCNLLQLTTPTPTPTPHSTNNKDNSDNSSNSDFSDNGDNSDISEVQTYTASRWNLNYVLFIVSMFISSKQALGLQMLKIVQSWGQIVGIVHLDIEDAF